MRAVTGFVAGGVAIVTWLFILSRLSSLSALAITDVAVYGVEPDLIPAMQAAAIRELDGNYMGLFSKADTLIYPKQAIIREVASTSPRIDNVNVSRNGLHALTISVSEKTPSEVICADLPDLSDTSQSVSKNCYFADEDSFMFKKATEPEAQNYLRYYIPDLPDTDITGTLATSSATFKKLEDIVGNIKSAGINVHSILVKGDGGYELYADNPSGPSSVVVIQMNDRAPLSTQSDNLIAFWNRMTADARVKGQNIGWSEIKLQYPPNIYSRALEGKSAK